MFDYTWDKFGLCSTWNWDADGQQLLLCFNLPPGIRASMIDSLLNQGGSIEKSSPFALITFALDHIIPCYDGMVWTCRDAIMGLERSRSKEAVHSSYFGTMHDLARQAIYCKETVSAVMVTLIEICEEYERWQRDKTGTAADGKGLLRSHLATLSYLELRSEALEARVTNEINLVSMPSPGMSHLDELDTKELNRD